VEEYQAEKSLAILDASGFLHGINDTNDTTSRKLLCDFIGLPFLNDCNNA